MNTIIFSKNRACQLDLLIRSVVDNIKLDFTISCIYKTEDEYDEGYEILKDSEISESDLCSDKLS
jgi:hypothetical protein